ncbi:MAG: hypothetical protein TR69_WS6001001207 [candidate division WS6 bacterium OLB20]|uniref:Uncharacterized protein n=1 Tax=candidate division WS6 bacterium OLB20 TaxID=1617426 RepID=A0A136LX30_9BACT|nr:MAG: hypothetical protein TR69_WS6001001207 [candidate division WS6 bacterium OLB20]
MPDDKIVLTKEGLADLEAELEMRLTETRKKIADDIEKRTTAG